MKKVTFLMADGVLKPSCLFGAIEVLQKANEFMRQQRQADYYDVILAGVNVEQQLLNVSFSLRGVQDISAVKETDVIILPSYDTRDDFAINSSRVALAWVAAQYKRGAEIASLCTGAFLLAATGLLKGRSCSTHWKAEAAFRSLFPDVNLAMHKVITDQKGLYTAGGAQSSLNLVLYLVENTMAGKPPCIAPKYYRST